MTNEKFEVSNKKPLRLLIPLFFAFITFAFSIGLIFSSTPVGDSEEITVDIAKLFIIAVPILIGSIAVCFFMLCLFVKSERFYFEDNKLQYYFTFVIKKRIALPLEKINIVKVKRNLIDLILGTSIVEIGSGSLVTSVKAEIRLCLSKQKAQYVADFIQRYSKAIKENAEFNEEFEYPTTLAVADNTKESVVIKMTKADKLKYALTHSALWGMTIFLTVLISLPSIISHFSLTEFFEVPFDEFALGITITSVATFVIVFISVICYAFIGFYNYTVTRVGDEIIIHYGLINIKTFSVPFDKIHGYEIGQNILRQLFGLGSLRLSVIGIDESADNNSVSVTYVYPCGNTNRIKEICKSLFPEFVAKKELTTAPKQSLIHTVLIPNLVKLLFLLPLLIYLAISLSVLALIIPLLLIVVFGGLRGLLIYKNAGIAIDSDFIYATSGGYYKKHTLIKTNSVQEISKFAGFIRRKQKLCTYFVIYRDSSLLSNKLFIRNLPEDSLDTLN